MLGKDKNMSTQNTLYIAEPIFSETLQKYGKEISFPPIKKIGITTDHPHRREKELLGTSSPVKVSIVKAWSIDNARNIETMLHTILDNSRLEGEYFWDGNDTLIEAVTEFINTYHSEAKEIKINENKDVKAASEAMHKQNSQRLYEELVPWLEQMKFKYTIGKNGKGLYFHLNDYKLSIGGRTGSRYTLTIWSKKKTAEEALKDFDNSQELSSNSTGDSNRKARIPMSYLSDILTSITNYMKKSNA